IERASAAPEHLTLMTGLHHLTQSDGNKPKEGDGGNQAVKDKKKFPNHRGVGRMQGVIHDIPKNHH
ncbi:hypothetical protein, partial [Candidatus Hamiltonella defensa]|uniref:hypothetical protein n=1 Tax=Candidatus Williamhamiltonella defendens TaxID=138072 RepID=UPI0015838594